MSDNDLEEITEDTSSVTVLGNVVLIDQTGDKSTHLFNIIKIDNGNHENFDDYVNAAYRLSRKYSVDLINPQFTDKPKTKEQMENDGFLFNLGYDQLERLLMKSRLYAIEKSEISNGKKYLEAFLIGIKLEDYLRLVNEEQRRDDKIFRKDGLYNFMKKQFEKDPNAVYFFQVARSEGPLEQVPAVKELLRRAKRQYMKEDNINRFYVDIHDGCNCFLYDFKNKASERLAQSVGMSMENMPIVDTTRETIGVGEMMSFWQIYEWK